MLKKSAGNMYDWVTHTHSHLAGKCPHECAYCYVQAMAARFPNMKSKYSGPIRIDPKELLVDYGSGKTIFIEHMNDLFAERGNDEVMDEQISQVLIHCEKYPDNKYVFQTKDPERAYGYLPRHNIKNYIIGTTIESNREYPQITGKTPTPLHRAFGIKQFSCEKFITIEPIMDFDVNTLVGWLKDIKPTFVNIGADSKRGKLPEPSADKVREFIFKVGESGITIRKKTNLSRIIGDI